MPDQMNGKSRPIQRGQKQTSHDQESKVQLKSNTFTSITASLAHRYTHTNNKKGKMQTKSQNNFIINKKKGREI